MHRFFLTKTKSALFIIIIYFLCSLPISLLSASLFRIQVVSKTIDIKQESSLSSETVATAVKGTIFEVSQELPDWYVIETPQGKAYLSKHYGQIKKIWKQKEETGKAGKKVQEKQYVLIVKPGSFIRRSPAHSAPSIATAKINNAFLLSAIKGEWFEIVIAKEEKGYVLQRIAKIINQQSWQELKSQTKAPVSQSQPPPKTEPAEIVPANTYAQIIKNNVKLRREPDAHGPVVATAKKGEVFKIVGKVHNWYEVFFSIESNAYLYAPLVKIVSEKDIAVAVTPKPATAPAKESPVVEKPKDILITIEGGGKKSAGRAKYVQITAPEVYLKAKASSSAPTALIAKKGEEFKLIWKLAKWYEVEIGPGKTAFVPSSQGEIGIREEIDYSSSEIPTESQSAETGETTSQGQPVWQTDIIPENTYFYVTRETSLSDAPSENGLTLGQAYKGNVFKIFSSHEHWYAIEISGGVAFISKGAGKTINRHEAKRIKEELQRENELKARQKAREEAAQAAAKKAAEKQERLKDKYILITSKKANLRKSSSEKAPIVSTVQLDEHFKLINQTKDWYKVHTSSGNAFIAVRLAKIITEQELNDYRAQQQKMLEEKLKKEKEALAKKEAEKAKEKARLEAEKQAKGTTQQKILKDLEKLEAEQKAKTATIKKIKEESDQNSRKLAAKQAAELQAKESEWLKDKYIQITAKQINVRKEPAKNADIIKKAKKGEIFKIISRTKDWYEIFLTLEQNAYVASQLGAVISEAELNKDVKNEKKVRIDEERHVAAEQARQEAELKVKQEAQRKAKEAAALKAQHEAELTAKEDEWLKDKYILVTLNHTNLRQKPNAAAKVIAKANTDEVFKLLSRSQKDWFEVAVSSGSAFINKQISKILSEQELNTFKAAQAKAKEEAELKARVAAEEKARKEAARKAQLEASNQKQQKTVAITVEAKAKQEAELKAKQETERKTKAEAEQKQQQLQEAKEQLAAGQKAKEQEWLKDKYIIITAGNCNIRKEQRKNAPIIAKAKKRETFKLISRTKDWYEIFLTMEQNGYVATQLATIITEAELKIKLENERKAHEEKERIAAAAKAKREAEEKTRQAALQAELEAKQKAREEAQRKAKEAAALKAQQEAELKAKEEEWLKDKYILTTLPHTNLRQKPNAAAKIIVTANADEAFKLLSRSQKEWFEVSVSSGSAFINKKIGKILTEQELNDFKAAQVKAKQEAELKAKLAAEEKARITAEEKAQKDAARKAQLEATYQSQEKKVAHTIETKAKQEAELKAKQEMERKAKAEAEEKRRQAEVEKERLAAEEKAKEQEWLKDKYIIITVENGNARKEQKKNGPITGKVHKGQTFKLISRTKDWYEIFLTIDENAFIATQLGTIITEAELKTKLEIEQKAREEKERLEAAERARKEAELKAKQEAEERARQEKAKTEAEAKAKREAEEKARQAALQAELEAKQKAREEAQRKAKEAAALKAQQEAELKAKEDEWLKDKYILIVLDHTNLRQKPNANARVIAKANADESFKLLSRSPKDWYEVAVSSGSAFINKQISKILSEQELNDLKTAQAKAKEEAELKARLAAEEKAKIAAEGKAKKEAEALAKLQAEQKAREEAEAKAKQEAQEKAQREAEEKARRAAEQQAKLEAKRKAREEAELKAKEAAALKAKYETEIKAKEEEWLKDKYVYITEPNKALREKPAPSAKVIDKTKQDDSFKLLSRAYQNWYKVAVSSGPAFVDKKIVKIVNEQELHELRLMQAKAKEEAEAKAKQEAQDKAQREAEERAKIEAFIADTYLLVTGTKTTLRQAPAQESPSIATAEYDTDFKVLWAEKDKKGNEWYKISPSSGTFAYLSSSMVKLVTTEELTLYRSEQQKARQEKERLEAAERARREAELKAKQEAEERARQEKAKTEAEAKAKREAEEKARQAALQAELEAKQKAREEAQRKAKEAAALKAQQEAELKAKEEEWLKDKYILVTLNHTNLRQKPNANARVIAKANADEFFKLLSRSQKDWFEVAVSSGSAFINKQISKILSEQELNTFKAAQAKAKEEAELKARLAAEEKARIAAEEKVKKEAEALAKLQAEQKAREEALLKAKKETEEKALREAEERARKEAELKTKLAAEQKAREEAENRARELAELKAKKEVEAAQKAKEEAELKTKEEETRLARLKAEEKAKKEAELLAKLEEEQRLLKEKLILEEETRQKRTTERKTKLEAEQKAKEEAEQKAKELAALRAELEAKGKAQQEAEEKLKKETVAQAQKEAELKAAEEAAKKARLEAEEKARKEAELLAKMEAEEKEKAELAKKEAARQEAEQKAQQEKARREEEARAKIEAFVKDKYVCITADFANIRQKPDKTASLLGKASRGEYYKLNWVVNEWYEIKISWGTTPTTGFVFGSLVKVINEAEYTALKQKEEQTKVAPVERKSEDDKKVKSSEFEDNKEYQYVAVKTSYAEVRSVPDSNAPSLFIALKDDIFKYNGQQKGWYHITTFTGETRYIQKAQCRGLSAAPAVPKDSTLRREIYDSIIDAKDRAMLEANLKYPAVKTQQQLQEKIFYQQNMEEKFVLDIFHKYKVQPVLYLAILQEAINNNW